MENIKKFLLEEEAKGKKMEDILNEIADAANEIKREKVDYSQPLNKNARLMAAIANNNATKEDIIEIMLYLCYPLSSLSLEDYSKLARSLKEDIKAHQNMVDEFIDFLDEFADFFQTR